MNEIKENKDKEVKWRIISSQWIALFMMYIIGFSVASIILDEYMMVFGISMTALILLFIALVIELIINVMRNKKETNTELNESREADNERERETVIMRKDTL